ncbi:BadF/BadG/BcrA/BcrD ATPase family protein [Kineococcus sp. SYSU DK003]|uniref:BadF/BadG/BcrA/BcrD ATPase family protein n=1 Tax=Kineococcus sp. SYSU DK003 TaxID=3383124 RepID=UPI003D7C9460
MIAGRAHGGDGERFLVGVDVGGTKVHVAASIGREPVLDVVRPSEGWAAQPYAAAARWLTDLLDGVLPGWSSASGVAVGAHGADSPEQVAALQRAVSAAAGRECTVVNDAELVLPAAGVDTGVGLIVGTGSIASGHTPDRPTITAGGWGWLLGDQGSAPALVLDAVRAILLRHDLGLPLDPLGEAFLEAYGVSSPPDLLVPAGTAGARGTWARHAPLVFSAAAAGSQDAVRVLNSAAAALADLVDRLARRGVDVRDVVVAGGVVRNQAGYVDRIAAAVRSLHPTAHVRRLDVEPVTGALVLAGRVAGGAASVPAIVRPGELLAS